MVTFACLEPKKFNYEGRTAEDALWNNYVQISFLIKSIGVDQVLTKIFQVDPKLTFNIFHILNHGRIFKIEKKNWWSRLQTPKKWPFFGWADLKS